MKTKTIHLNIGLALVVLVAAVGCSKQSSTSADSDSEQSPTASKELAAGDDQRAEEILKSRDIMEARDWVRRYPKSLFSPHAIDEDAEGGTPLGPVVERLLGAGAQRVVVHHANNAILLGVVVVLPTDVAARQKVFAIEPELSQLCQQTQAKDHGQKYLYYTPD